MKRTVSGFTSSSIASSVSRAADADRPEVIDCKSRTDGVCTGNYRRRGAARARARGSELASSGSIRTAAASAPPSLSTAVEKLAARPHLGFTKPQRAEILMDQDMHSAQEERSTANRPAAEIPEDVDRKSVV